MTTKGRNINTRVTERMAKIIADGYKAIDKLYVGKNPYMLVDRRKEGTDGKL